MAARRALNRWRRSRAWLRRQDGLGINSPSEAQHARIVGQQCIAAVEVLVDVEQEPAPIGVLDRHIRIQRLFAELDRLGRQARAPFRIGLGKRAGEPLVDTLFGA